MVCHELISDGGERNGEFQLINRREIMNGISINCKMRFYAFVIAFAAVFISHDVDAVARKAEIPRIELIRSIEDSLIQYQNNRSSFFILDEHDVYPKELAESMLREIVEVDLKGKGIQGEDLNNYRYNLQLHVENHLHRYQFLIQICAMDRKIEALVDREIDRLERVAEDLMNDIAYVEDCEKISIKKCIRLNPRYNTIGRQFQEWEKDVYKLIHNEHPSNLEEEKKMKDCVNSSLDKFRKYLLNLKNRVLLDVSQSIRNIGNELATEPSP